MKNLLSIRDLGADGIKELLDRVDRVRVTPLAELRNHHPHKVVSTVFMEPSTRTRLSFELAAQRLGADVISFTYESSSAATKGESLQDTIQTLSAMDTALFVVRNKEEGSSDRIAHWTAAKVVNGGEGTTSHPTQGLIEVLTLRDARPHQEFVGMREAIVGDVRHSRVARSNAQALTALGADVVLVAPLEFQPDSLEEFAMGPGRVEFSTDLDEVLPKVDAVHLLRVQLERHGGEETFDGDAYVQSYGLNADRLAKLPTHAVVTHAGPMNRGIEIDDAIADGDRALINQMVTNGLHIRTALIDWMLND